MVEMTDAAAKRRRRQQRPTEEEEGSSVGGTGMSKPLSPTTTTTGVDIVPNGIAFNVAKRWLKVDASSNSHSSNNVISLEAFLNASKREEREEKPRSQRLGLGAKYLSHSKASRTMRTISEKKIIDRMERERKREEERKLDLKRAMESSSESDDDDEDVRGLSKSKKKNRVENFDASKYRKK
tara:strand:+ start:66 stop:611 length:546 start_codon:yes stop_codon:yes gene_type:complete